LFKFEREQRVFDLGGVKVGGQPGQYPTAMIGSIFYHGDKTVLNEKEGAFNTKKAEALIKQMEEISEKTGNPSIIDVVGAWPGALARYIDFVADKTDSPFLVDGATSDVRVAGVKHVMEVGLAGRAIYNTIMPGCKKEEVNVLKESGIKSAVLLTFNQKMPTIAGRLEALEELLKVAEEAGIEKPIVDTTILDVPDPGPTGKAIYLVKDRYGLPAGCGAHNAIDRWHERRKLDKTRYLMSSAVAFTFTIVMGGDFLLYGPINRAPQIFPSVALADAYVAYSMKQEYGIGPAVKDHPLSKVFSL